jgi:hypothetical protein
MVIRRFARGSGRTVWVTVRGGVAASSVMTIQLPHANARQPTLAGLGIDHGALYVAVSEVVLD